MYIGVQVLQVSPEFDVNRWALSVRRVRWRKQELKEAYRILCFVTRKKKLTAWFLKKSELLRAPSLSMGFFYVLDKDQRL